MIICATYFPITWIYFNEFRKNYNEIIIDIVRKFTEKHDKDVCMSYMFKYYASDMRRLIRVHRWRLCYEFYSDEKWIFENDILYIIDKNIESEFEYMDKCIKIMVEMNAKIDNCAILHKINVYTSSIKEGIIYRKSIQIVDD